jgi:hypothetical protein
MSQHIFNATTADGENVTVTMGYDRPLDFVFCTVIADGGKILYSHLDDTEAATHQQEVDYYRGVLQQYGITVPDSVFQEVQADQLQRVGNRVVVHDAAR